MYWNFIEEFCVGVIENPNVFFYFLSQDKNNFENFGIIDVGLEFFNQLMAEYGELLGYKYIVNNF